MNITLTRALRTVRHRASGVKNSVKNSVQSSFRSIPKPGFLTRRHPGRDQATPKFPSLTKPDSALSGACPPPQVTPPPQVVQTAIPPIPNQACVTAQNGLRHGDDSESLVGSQELPTDSAVAQPQMTDGSETTRYINILTSKELRPQEVITELYDAFATALHTKTAFITARKKGLPDSTKLAEQVVRQLTAISERISDHLRPLPSNRSEHPTQDAHVTTLLEIQHEVNQELTALARATSPFKQQLFDLSCEVEKLRDLAKTSDASTRPAHNRAATHKLLDIHRLLSAELDRVIQDPAVAVGGFEELELHLNLAACEEDLDKLPGASSYFDRATGQARR